MKKEAPIMEVHGLGKTFRAGEREVSAIESIEFNVRKGEFLCMVGPTGCGKSTLLKIMTGLETPTSGSVTYNGRAVKGPQPGMSIISHDYALLPWLSVIDNVALPLELKGARPDERQKLARKYISLVGLEGFEDKHVKDLSPGMKTRVGMARSLVGGPEIIFMDEPFGSLDAYTMSILRRDLVKMLEEAKNTTIVMTTNSLAEAIALADRVLVLSSRPGRIKGMVSIDMERPRSETSKTFTNYYRKAFALLETRKMGSESEELG